LMQIDWLESAFLDLHRIRDYIRQFNADFHGPKNNQSSDACRGQGKVNSIAR
jgi:hypothetical protein